MKIATVTLNPAIDQTVKVVNFQPNAVNRSHDMQFDAGGKGVNVASFLADYGCKVAVTGFLGADNPRIFESLFLKKGIADHFIRIPGRTRTNIKIVDEQSQETTDINMAGEAPSAQALEALLHVIENLAGTSDWFVLAGNLPPRTPNDIYAQIIAKLRQHNKCVALDTSREALAEGLRAIPTIAKPNIEELQQVVGHALETEQDVREAATQLLETGIRLVVVSMGARGALFVSKEEAFRAVPPSVTVMSTVGAGDAMVAGLIAGQSQNYSLQDCARLATAFSLGAVTRVGAHLPDSATLNAYFRQVSIQNLD